MVLIIGGAYQGKLDYAKERFHLTREDICICTPGKIDFSRKCLYGLEEFVYGMEDPIGYFREHREQWEDRILICQDIFCGVVPMGAENRLWRQETGRLCQYLSREADEVIRMFCGLEQRLK